MPHNSRVMAARMVGHFRPPTQRGDVAKVTPAPLSAAAQAGDLLPEETNEVVSLPRYFFCQINSASGRVRWPHFMNDGNLLRPSICPNPQHLHSRLPSAPASTCTETASLEGGRWASSFLIHKCDMNTSFQHGMVSITLFIRLLLCQLF